jgi:delta24-sterol reductase
VSLWHLFQEENPDLFYAIPWSHGTLGFLVAAEIRIVPAKKYVRLEYQPVKHFDDITKTLVSAAKDTQNEFIEGLMFSETEAVVMTGRMTDDLEPDKVKTVFRLFIFS